MSDIQFRLLGPLLAEQDGEQLALGRPKEQAVLAVLLLQPNRPVMTSNIIKHVWMEDADYRAAPSNLVAGCITALKKSLNCPSWGINLVGNRSPSAYTAVIDRRQIDACRFEDLALQALAATRESDTEESRRLLRKARSIWPDGAQVLEGIVIDSSNVALIGKLYELRFAVAESIARVELEADSRDPAEIASELATLAKEPRYSERESLAALRMRALLAAGRPAESNEVLQNLTESLARRGLTPTARLTELQQKLHKDRATPPPGHPADRAPEPSDDEPSSTPPHSGPGAPRSSSTIHHGRAHARVRRAVVLTLLAAVGIDSVLGVASTWNPKLIPILWLPWLPAAIACFALILTSGTSYTREDERRLLSQVRVQLGWRQRGQSNTDGPILDLGLRECLDALLLHPPGLHRVIGRDASNVPLPAGWRVVDEFDKCGNALLILGKPGSGKTTALLELTERLLDRAEDDPHHRLPVFLSLASWGGRDRNLDAWMIRAMRERYDLPLSTGADWIRTGRILPLLDGLDEVAAEHQDRCVSAINRYRNQHGPNPPLAVTARTADYKELGAQLALLSAVEIQPPSSEQVSQYLHQAGIPEDKLRILLDQNEDDETQEFYRSPLTLSMIAVTNETKQLSDLGTSASLAELRDTLFTQYVNHGLANRTRRSHSPEKMRSWLAWIASTMRASGAADRSKLRPDRMQPGVVANPFLLDLIVAAPVVTWWALTIILKMIEFRKIPHLGLLLLFVVSTVCIGGVIRAINRRRGIAAIEPMQPMRFFSQSALQGALTGMAWAPVLLIVEFIENSEETTRLSVASLELSGAIAGFLLGGWQRVIHAGAHENRPGLGVRRSIYGVLISGVVSGIGLRLLVQGTPVINIVLFAAACCLGFGGIPLLRHAMLRCVLALTGAGPLRYNRFLRQAEQGMILRRVGDGYVFEHGLLLDHLADSGAAKARIAGSRNGQERNVVTRTRPRRISLRSRLRLESIVGPVSSGIRATLAILSDAGQQVTHGSRIGKRIGFAYGHITLRRLEAAGCITAVWEYNDSERLARKGYILTERSRDFARLFSSDIDLDPVSEDVYGLSRVEKRLIGLIAKLECGGDAVDLMREYESEISYIPKRRRRIAQLLWLMLAIPLIRCYRLLPPSRRFKPRLIATAGLIAVASYEFLQAFPRLQTVLRSEPTGTINLLVVTAIILITLGGILAIVGAGDFLPALVGISLCIPNSIREFPISWQPGAIYLGTCLVSGLLIYRWAGRFDDPSGVW